MILVTEQDCPHLLFYGPPGSGKKTLIMALLRQIFGASAEKVKVENKNWKVDRLLYELLKKLDFELKHEVCHWAAYYASKVLKFEENSLEFLLRHFCKVAAHEEYENADWRLRPLTDEMLRYKNADWRLRPLTDAMLRWLRAADLNGQQLAIVAKAAAFEPAAKKLKEEHIEMIIVETGKIGRQASGSVTIRDGGTVLVCRQIDRALRPTMPKDFYHETQIRSEGYCDFLPEEKLLQAIEVAKVAGNEDGVTAFQMDIKAFKVGDIVDVKLIKKKKKVTSL
ncbi:putative ribosomal protein S5 domain 2-type [Helianthus annuus]|nr:putative ribosomal protein S5 domain 2-type [Helianthus annuus]